MKKITDDLRAIPEERVPLKDEFAVAGHVREAARTWPRITVTRVDEACAMCRQVMVPISSDREFYVYTDEEEEGLVLAHLMQRHGWTRETTGER